MSLATRCTACGTAFRVVEDQLKVSEGWVRCGRCSEVFNAREGLFELTHETMPEWQQPQSDGFGADADADADDRAYDFVSSSDAEAAPQASSDESAESAHDSETAFEEEIEAHLLKARRAAGHRGVAAHIDERDRLDFSDARFDSELMADSVLDEAREPVRVAGPAESPLEAPVAPEFLRRAESRARWQRPKVRTAMALAASTLLVLLALQTGHQFRDLAAAQWPILRPALVQWCAIAGCTIEPPRRIEDITVDSTALAKVAGSDAFRLAVTLHSRGAVAVALPWIDLSLTDANGKVLARKALAAQAFRPAATVLQPGAEIVLQTLLTARDSQVTGYTVEIFYP